MNQNEKLTSANIRYLLTIKLFTDAGKPIRNSYLAEHFHYKKSSIHAMLKHLTALGLIEKDESNIVLLTEKGTETAVRYQAYYDKLDVMMRKCFPELQHPENAILAVLAEIPKQELQHFMQQN